MNDRQAALLLAQQQAIQRDLQKIRNMIQAHDRRIFDLENDVADVLPAEVAEEIEETPPPPPAFTLKKRFAGKWAVAKGDELLTEDLPRNEAAEELRRLRAEALN